MPSWTSSEDWATVGPCWVGSIVLRCQLGSASWRQVHAADVPCHDGLSPGLPTDAFRLTEFVYLGQWIALRLKFRDPETTKKIASRKALWLTLSVDHEVADVLAEDLQLEFARGALQVSSTCQDRGVVVRLIVDTFKTVWRFTKFSDSRWVTLGPASQAVVAAALCGLENSVSFFRSKVGAFPYHFGVFSRFLGRQAASVCRVSDNIFHLLLKDPSVFLQCDDMWKAVCIRRACLGCVFGRQCVALARRRGRGRSG